MKINTLIIVGFFLFSFSSFGATNSNIDDIANDLLAGNIAEARSEAQKEIVLTKARIEKAKRDLVEATKKESLVEIREHTSILEAHKIDLVSLKQIAEQAEAAALISKKPKRDRFAARSLKVNRIKKTDLFDDFEAAGLLLRKSSGAADSQRPAQASFLRNIGSGSDTVYSTDFYLKWTPEKWQKTTRSSDESFNFSIEGHLTSENSNAQDAWTFRASKSFIRHYGKSEDRLLNGYHFDMSIKNEADRDFNFHRLSAEFLLSPTWTDIGMGSFSPSHNDVYLGEHPPLAEHPIQFRWRPYFGADLGGVISGSESAAGSGVADESWLIYRTTAEVALNFLEQPLGIEEVILHADYNYRYAIDSEKSFNHFEVGLDFMFTENVGFGLTYKNGERAPSFVDEEIFQGSLTLKF